MLNLSLETLNAMLIKQCGMVRRHVQKLTYIIKKQNNNNQKTNTKKNQKKPRWLGGGKKHENTRVSVPHKTQQMNRLKQLKQTAKVTLRLDCIHSCFEANTCNSNTASLEPAFSYLNRIKDETRKAVGSQID